jgi:hypothetical protein
MGLSCVQQLYSSDLTASQWQDIEKLIAVRRKVFGRFTESWKQSAT